MMRRRHIAARYLSAASALATVLTMGAGTPAFAAKSGVVVDGEPTPEACAAYGFRPAGGETETFIGVAPPLAMPAPMVVQGTVADTLAMEGRSVAFGGAVPAPPFVPGQPVDTENYPDVDDNPVQRTLDEPLSTFSIDVDTASYSNLRRFLLDGQAPPTDAVRIEELINYFDYDYALPRSADEPFAASVTVAPSPWAEGRQIVHIGLQGYDLPPAEQPPLNLVFLVDVSGSMWSPDRLPLAQRALDVLVDELRPEDTVSMVVYAGAAGAVLEPTPGTQKLRIRCAISSLEAGGSTAGGQGLELAYDLAERNFSEDAVNRVVLMTDGDFNVGIADPERLEDLVADERDTGIYLSVFGFGRGNYNDVMMQTLSQAGNGTAGYIDTFEEANRLFHEDFASSLFPIADDVKIQVEFNPARVAEYRLIGYETRLLDAADFNNDQVDAGEVGSGASVTAIYEITPVGGPLQIPPLRFGDGTGATEPSGDYAYLSIRYKLPGEDESRLMERPITPADRVDSVAAAPEATRWALAVAAYGQLLRDAPYLAPGFGWAAVHDLAAGALGEDPYGIRAEFLDLVERAQRIGGPAVK